MGLQKTFVYKVAATGELAVSRHVFVCFSTSFFHICSLHPCNVPSIVLVSNWTETKEKLANRVKLENISSSHVGLSSQVLLERTI